MVYFGEESSFWLFASSYPEMRFGVLSHVFNERKE